MQAARKSIDRRSISGPNFLNTETVFLLNVLQMQPCVCLSCNLNHPCIPVQEFRAREISWYGLILRWQFDPPSGDDVEVITNSVSDSDVTKSEVSVTKSEVVVKKGCVVEVYELDPTRSTRLLHYRGNLMAYAS